MSFHKQIATTFSLPTKVTVVFLWISFSFLSTILSCRLVNGKKINATVLSRPLVNGVSTGHAFWDILGDLTAKVEAVSVKHHIGTSMDYSGSSGVLLMHAYIDC